MKKYYIEERRGCGGCLNGNIEFVDGDKATAIAEAEDMFDRMCAADKKKCTGENGSMIVHEVEVDNEEQWEDIKGGYCDYDTYPVWDADTYWALCKADEELRDAVSDLDMAREASGDDDEACEDELKAYTEAQQAYDKVCEAYMMMVG